jgi:DNA polymerase III subunit alpha
MSSQNTSYKFIPLNCKSHYTIRRALSRPKDLNTKVTSMGYEGFGLADDGVISGCVQFKAVNKNAIIGVELCTDNGDCLLIYAKNKEGWLDLCKITSEANANFSGVLNKPIIIKDKIEKILVECKNLVVVYKYLENNPVAGSYYGIDLNQSNYIELRSAAAKKGIPAVCIHEIRYADPKDRDDFALLLSISENEPVGQIKERFSHYFNDIYYVPSVEEVIGLGYTKEEIENTHNLFSLCSPYSLFSNPILPKFPLENTTAKEELRKLCERKPLNQQYKERLDRELEVIFKYNLEDYFLIIADIINYCNKKYGISGIRGSGSGSMVSYLLGIAKTDPVKYNLLFERFLNAGRFTEDRVQLPDIDIDVPADAREDIIQYIKDKYGVRRVGQILTYQRIKTAAAIKAVFRNSSLSFKEVNEITQQIPDAAKISDKLKEMGETSPLMYSLKTDSDFFRQWVYINDQNELDGEYKEEFKQVLRLEGLNSARSKHAAGVIVAPTDLEDFCPLIWDASDKKLICGMEMNDLESIGCLKVDILGLRLFDKIIEIKQMVENEVLRT